MQVPCSLSVNDDKQSDTHDNLRRLNQSCPSYVHKAHSNSVRQQSRRSKVTRHKVTLPAHFRCTCLTATLSTTTGKVTKKSWTLSICPREASMGCRTTKSFCAISIRSKIPPCDLCCCQEVSDCKEKDVSTCQWMSQFRRVVRALIVTDETLTVTEQYSTW